MALQTDAQQKIEEFAPRTTKLTKELGKVRHRTRSPLDQAIGGGS